MNPEGYKLLVDALASDPTIEATVTPEPAEGEDLRYVTVVLGDKTYHASILNAIERAGLVQTRGFTTFELLSTPGLAIATYSSTQITFEDKHVHPN